MSEATIWQPGEGEQIPGPTGPRGPNLELQTSSTHVQWRVAGDSTWINLIPITELVGPQGNSIVGPRGPRGPQGPVAAEILFRVTDTYIQWKYVTYEDWINLVALEDLVGPPGPAAELPLNNWEAEIAPTSANDSTEGYTQGSYWVDTVADNAVYLCIDATEDSAVWVAL